MTAYLSRLLLLALLVPPLQAAAATPLDIEDFGKIRAVGAPRLSADGTLTAFTLDGRIFVVPTAGGNARAVTLATSSASDPYFSRDGASMYFLSDRTGTTQLWRLDLDAFGEAEQLSSIERGVHSLRMPRDASRLLLSYDDEADDTGPDEEPGPWVINRLQFKEDAGDGYLTSRPSDHIYIYDIANRQLVQVTDGAYAESDAAWSPDGDEIVFVSNREEEPDETYRKDLWIVAARGGEPRIRRLTDDDGVKDSPQFSPDGRHVAFLSAEDGVYGISRLAIMPAAGGATRILSGPLDRWVSSFRFAPDGKSIYFLYDDRGGRHLGRVKLADGSIDTVVDGDRYVTAFDIDDRDALVVRSASGNRAADIYRVAGGELHALSDANAEFFAGHDLGRVEKVTYTVADGTEVDAFVTLPPGYRKGRRYPTILNIHGGPVGQFSWGWSFRAQYFAAHGYVVVEPNPRGSTGRGQDFVRAIYRTWGVTDLPDVLGAVDRVIELGYADPERLAVTGYSYGGYMTNTVITHSQRFRAAASGAGHSLIAANYGHDIYQKWYNWELGLPSENRAAYDRLSPFTQVQEVTTPTIFLGGRQDWNVPVLNAELMYQALRHRGIDSRLVVYPGMHHGGWSERFDKDYLVRVVDWFDRYTGETAAR